MLQDLNTDCLLHIFHFLHYRDKINLLKTCKRLYFIGQEEGFKDEYVMYKRKHKQWIQKYKPNVISKHVQLPRFIKKVKFLILKEKKLKHIPKTTFQYEMIDISQNCITSFPIFETVITEINISYNNINMIESISYLVNLQLLKVSNCNLSQLPADISNMKSLKYLYCNDNHLQCIPDLTNTSLIELSAENNEISTQFNIPETLEKLDLSYNNLNSFKIGQNLTRLRKLNLSHNNLDIFEIHQDYLELDISYNNLTTISSKFPITNLNVRNNRICKIDLIECRDLNLTFNYISNLESIYNLEYLVISYNPIEILPEFPNLTLLWKNDLQKYEYTCKTIINE